MRLLSIALAVLALAGCGGGGASPTTSGAGGVGGAAGNTSGSSGKGGAGGGVPQCPGVPVPTGDVPGLADGRSVEVACAGVSLLASVVESGVLRLRYRGSAVPSGRASYAVVGAPDPGAHPLFGSTKDTVLVCTDDLLLQIGRSDCRVRALGADGGVLVDDPDGGGYFEGLGLGRGVARSTAPGERFYGFGEKTGPLDKRGRAITFWNT